MYENIRVPSNTSGSFINMQNKCTRLNHERDPFERISLCFVHTNSSCDEKRWENGSYVIAHALPCDITFYSVIFGSRECCQRGPSFTFF